MRETGGSMQEPPLIEIERVVARCRMILSLAAFVAIYIDPTRPTLTRWLPLTGGPFTLDPYAYAVMAAHVVYSGAVSAAVAARLVTPARIAIVSTWADVVFGVCIALVTEGVNSPFYVFFAFAVLAVGFRAGLRQALAVTAASVVLYLSLILVSRPEGVSFYTMRPAYLAITGYLVGYLGKQRLRLASRLRVLEAANQRKEIARSLHDGYAQALAGVNLRVEGCRELLRRGRGEEAFVELTELQAGVNREHDDLRAYIRSLVDRDLTGEAAAATEAARFSIRVCFDGSLMTVEHVLQILLEGARNVARHARARRATMSADASETGLSITIDDDGVGFPAGATPPWSISSRAAELGGAVRIGGAAHPGGHVAIEIPRC